MSQVTVAYTLKVQIPLVRGGELNSDPSIHLESYKEPFIYSFIVESIKDFRQCEITIERHCKCFKTACLTQMLFQPGCSEKNRARNK